jgi:hypothetical protein
MYRGLGVVAVTAAVAVYLACGGPDARDGAALRADEIQRLGAGSQKVIICHIPPGNPANAHTIVVGAPAEAAHMAHGDTAGPCNARAGALDAGEPDAGEPDGGEPIS